MTRQELNTAFRKLNDYAQAVDFILNNFSEEDAGQHWVRYELNEAKAKSDALLRIINKIISKTDDK
jgi:flagellar hook-basal body complex protein FliE